jgi:hypothetical protein
MYQIFWIIESIVAYTTFPPRATIPGFTIYQRSWNIEARVQRSSLSFTFV